MNRKNIAGISVLLSLALIGMLNPEFASAQAGRPVTITNLGSWTPQNSIAMVNIPNGLGIPLDECYNEATHARDYSNISVLIEYADAWPGPVTHLNLDAWKLVIDEIPAELESCLATVADSLEGSSPILVESLRGSMT